MRRHQFNLLRMLLFISAFAVGTGCDRDDNAVKMGESHPAETHTGSAARVVRSSPETKDSHEDGTPYDADSKLLADLTYQQWLFALDSACGLANSDREQLHRVLERVARKTLISREISLDGVTKTWKGPSGFIYHDPIRQMNVEVKLAPPRGEIQLQSWYLDYLQRGGVVVMPRNEPPSYKDVFIGKDYVDIAFRILEGGSAAKRIDTIGDEMVHLDAPRELRGITGWGFESDWLGERVWMVMMLPVTRAHTRWRLNPMTHEPEVVRYAPPKFYLPYRIDSAREITEFDYNDYGIEMMRRVYRNEGGWYADGKTMNAIKGALLRTARQKLLVFGGSPRERTFVREWTDEASGEKTVEHWESAKWLLDRD